MTMLGMPRMPYRPAIAGSASVSSFPSRTRGSSRGAAISKLGVIMRHGPHHSAQKSITMGKSLLST
jgi:hypothetical protein